MRFVVETIPVRGGEMYNIRDTVTGGLVAYMNRPGEMAWSNYHAALGYAGRCEKAAIEAAKKDASPSQFVIWGRAPGAEHESLLVSEMAGLKDRPHAERTMTKLAAEHGCTQMRIQQLEPLGSASDLVAMWRDPKLLNI